MTWRGGGLEKGQKKSHILIELPPSSGDCNKGGYKTELLDEM